MLSINLSGHLAVVTGGTGQLGRVMVRTMAVCGAGVVIQYHRNVSMARQLLSEVRAAGLPGMIVQADVMSQLIDFIEAELPNGFDTFVGERGIRLSGWAAPAYRSCARTLPSAIAVDFRRSNQRARCDY